MAWKSPSSPISSKVGGLECRPVAGEITYGLERLAMYIQGKESVYDLVCVRHWRPHRHLRRCLPPERSRAEPLQLRPRGILPPCSSASPSASAIASACSRLIRRCRWRAYERVVATSHAFKPARRARRDQRHRAAGLHPARTHAGARRLREAYFKAREALGFPMLKPLPETA